MFAGAGALLLRIGGFAGLGGVGMMVFDLAKVL